MQQWHKSFFCQALSGAKMQSLSTPIIGMLRTFIYTMVRMCVSVECGNKGITAVSLQCLMHKGSVFPKMKL